MAGVLDRASSLAFGVAIGASIAGLLWTAPATLDYLMSGDSASIVGSMQESYYVEAAREFTGLAIVLVVLILALRGIRRQN